MTDKNEEDSLSRFKYGTIPIMKEEIVKVIKESSTPEEASEIIMKFILATKYEW